MIDTHAHLTSRFCDAQRKIDITAVILAASCIKDSKENVELAKNNPQLFAAVGVHPQDTDPGFKKSIDEQINMLDELAKNNKIVAIGECGLDYSTPPPGESERSKKDQDILFRGQICLALKYELPLIIHTRDSMDEAIKILSEYKNTKGVVHCYTGGKKRIKRVLELGENWFFGIDGNVTYEVGLNEVVKEIPKDRLLAETDSPFLTPIPHRGEVNNPNFVRFVYEKIAEIWNMDIKETEKILDENAKRLFNLDIRQ